MIIRIPIRILKNYGDGRAYNGLLRADLLNYFGPLSDLIISDFEVPSRRNELPHPEAPPVVWRAAYKTSKDDLQDFVSRREHSLLLFISEPFIRMVILKKLSHESRPAKKAGKKEAIVDCN